jgi:DNA anti-recombination protein RmuC
MMEAMTKSWTDERLEERFDAIDQRFDAIDQRFDGVDRRLDRVETDIRELRGEMNARFDQSNSSLNARFDKMNAEMKAGFDRVDERFEAMHRLMIQGGIVIIAALLGLIGTQL